MFSVDKSQTRISLFECHTLPVPHPQPPRRTLYPHMNNTSRLKIYGILAAALIVVAGVVWFYPGKALSGKARSVRTVVTTEKAKRIPTKLVTPPANAPQWPKKDPNNPNVEIYDGFTVIRNMPPLYIHQNTLKWILNRNLNSNLSDEQLKDFTTRYLEIMLARLQIESIHAQVTKTGDNVYEVEIPAYEEGKKLHDALAREINQFLASIGKTQHAESIETDLNRENINWGVSPQKITVVYEGKDIYKITHRFYSYLPVVEQNRLIEFENSTGIRVRSVHFSDYYFIIRKINYLESLQTNNNPPNPS